ncbi:hypothetical protein CNYM01_13050 [Colletotrichum nymphaeae SA-01]|uniref:Uncharacterized protein n=1 Tax=Colletotrichum nymphaeae SA-01 TaxID=1460502 RepID=A0A135TJZ3_9PEZI|nr:hypothetical protein CNYM01_13050 [Colletotrichum nymphaeae SA-01]
MNKFFLPVLRMLFMALFWQLAAAQATCAEAPVEITPLFSSWTSLIRQPNGVYHGTLQVGAAAGQPPRAECTYSQPSQAKKGVILFVSRANFRQIMCVAEDKTDYTTAKCFWLNAGDTCKTNILLRGYFFIVSEPWKCANYDDADCLGWAQTLKPQCNDKCDLDRTGSLVRLKHCP